MHPWIRIESDGPLGRTSRIYYMQQLQKGERPVSEAHGCDECDQDYGQQHLSTCSNSFRPIEISQACVGFDVHIDMEKVNSVRLDCLLVQGRFQGQLDTLAIELLGDGLRWKMARARRWLFGRVTVRLRRKQSRRLVETSTFGSIWRDYIARP